MATVLFIGGTILTMIGIFMLKDPALIVSFGGIVLTMHAIAWRLDV